jgi:AcrR family transcriptional regulator
MSNQSNLLEQRFMEGFELMVPDRSTRQILLHAVEVFARKGLAGTKIKDIAANAGFSQGYVYHYFKSKDDIFTALVDLAAEGAGSSVRYASELEGTPYQRIVWLTEAFLSPDSIAMQHWRLIMLQSATSDAIPEKAKQIMLQKRGRPFEYFLPLLLEGQKSGEIVQEDPLLLAVTYFSIIQGLGITRMQTGKESPFPSAEMALRFLKKTGRGYS